MYGISFQRDGSLVATTGMDSLGRVWDLRTGKCVMVLEGHVKDVLCVDWSPDGHTLATGGEDHAVRIWDLRKKKSIYTLPAHNSLVSSVRFSHEQGSYLVTASFDDTAKVWSGSGFIPLCTLTGHEGRVMCCDVSPDSRFIATTGFDRTIKLWTDDAI